MNIQRKWLGLDIPAASFDAAIAEEGADPNLRLAARSYPRNAEGIRACLGESGTLFGAVLESTGIYSQEAAAWLREALPGLRVCVANPMQVKAYGRSLGVRNKNDKVDARVIAGFGASRRPKASWVPDPVQMQLRDLLKERNALSQMLQNERKRQFSGHRIVLEEVRSSLHAQMKEGIKRLEHAMWEVAKQHPKLFADIKRVMTITGVGPIVSITVLALLGDLRRFKRGRELAAFAGISPQQHTSGTSVQGRTRMCKQGNRHVRRILYLAAMSSIKVDGPLKVTYAKLIARGKARKSALGAVMRRILLLMRAVLVTETDYRRSEVRPVSV
jgi:transposase